MITGCPGNTGHLDPKAILANVKEHCLMGIKGTVRRNRNGHFIHANIEPGHQCIITEEVRIVWYLWAWCIGLWEILFLSSHYIILALAKFANVWCSQNIDNIYGIVDSCGIALIIIIIAEGECSNNNSCIVTLVLAKHSHEYVRDYLPLFALCIRGQRWPLLIEGLFYKLLIWDMGACMAVIIILQLVFSGVLAFEGFHAL